jgi:hypothetical protein
MPLAINPTCCPVDCDCCLPDGKAARYVYVTEDFSCIMSESCPDGCNTEDVDVASCCEEFDGTKVLPYQDPGSCAWHLEYYCAGDQVHVLWDFQIVFCDSPPGTITLNLSIGNSGVGSTQSYVWRRTISSEGFDCRNFTIAYGEGDFLSPGIDEGCYKCDMGKFPTVVAGDGG